MRILKQGLPVVDLEDWRVRAGPKSPDQWKDGRSAKETARAWLGAGAQTLPTEVAELLASSPHFGPPTNWTAEPEARLPFDGFPGEPRNSDLVLYCTDAHGDYVAAVEAKADETFGQTIEDALGAALERRLSNPRSNGIPRIVQLATALLGARGPSETGVADLRYQLLTATAGVLCEAERRGASRAIFLIHEFVTDQTNDDRHAANAVDLDRFVHRLSRGSQSALHEGTLAGPFMVHGQPLLAAPIQLYIGKAVRLMRTGNGALG